MQLESPQVTVRKSAADMYDFLAEFKNFEQIMPDEVVHFEAAEDSFLFELKGMPKVKLYLLEKEPHSKIILTASNRSKIPFQLHCLINAVDAANCQMKLVFNGTLNPMMRMMVEKPLRKFLNVLSGNMETL